MQETAGSFGGRWRIKKKKEDDQEEKQVSVGDTFDIRLVSIYMMGMMPSSYPWERVKHYYPKYYGSMYKHFESYDNEISPGGGSTVYLHVRPGRQAWIPTPQKILFHALPTVRMSKRCATVQVNDNFLFMTSRVRLVLRLVPQVLTVKVLDLPPDDD